MKKATKEELLKLGFKEDEHEEEKCLSLKLNKGKDRFYHFLRWYEDASFIYTKATSDLQEDISNWVTNNKEEIEQSISEATNKTLNQFAEGGTTFDITDEVDKDELVTQITEDIIQGILNVISTYEQEV